ncbi:MAG: response regulator transcription factor [Armatimonadota bacterium]|nr:response regulator transcription factor [Armatimonadota bacterium]MDR7438961.1 response regulator transcription factor [Armatimonadota bacterium]MDR7562859.1 response regulator transcription factor [Armatimonadota bacterium]MDR7602336.1 response regulator transcription factor [Armatimonadota bacterium]
MEKLRVLVVDDTTLVRQGLRSLLEHRERIDLVGEAASAQEAYELLEALRPDVVLVDQEMPGLDLVEAIRLFKSRLPEVEVIVLAEWADEEQAFRAIEAGATGYVLKDIHIENLVRAIEGVTSGRTLIHPRITRQLVERFRLLMRERQDQNGSILGGLTSRELEILLQMVKGATDREIASRMFLSATTVKSHIRSIFRKIGARNRTQAVAYALRNGWHLRSAYGQASSADHGESHGG